MKNTEDKEDTGGMLSGAVELKIDGVPAKLELEVPANSVKPQKILPVLQEMTNSFVRISEASVKRSGKNISCRAGCNACCSQLVPISKIEAHSIAKLVSDLPEDVRTTVNERFNKAIQRLTETGWLSRMDNGKDLSADERHGLAMEYLQEGIECPFLENEICSIHSARPLACREYAVTSPAENCSEPTEETIEPLPVSVPVSATAHKLSAGIIGDGKPGYIPLVSALKWSKDNPDHYPRKTGPEWMQLIIENLNRPERTA